MKRPEKAPDWLDMMKHSTRDILELAKSQAITNVLQKANEEYLYWDRFKYITLPKSITAEIAWAYLKLTRNSQIRKAPVTDKKNNKFGFWLPDSVLKELHYVDQRASGQILADDPSIHSGEKEKYLINSIMEEAIASSLLEGAATTRKKAKELLRSGRKPRDTAEQMIVNNYSTIKNIKQVLKESLSPKLLQYLQASITRETLEDHSASGRFRNESEPIEVVDEMEGEVLFVPPPAEEINRRIGEMCKYANEKNDKEFTHPVVKAIILHFWVAYIHPFVDGNGRTARAIFYWYLLRNGYWLFEYLSVSRAIIKSPGQYKRAYLYSEIDDRDITYFISFNLRAIHKSIEGLYVYLKKQQRIVQESKAVLKKYPGLNYRQQILLHHALTHLDSVYSIEHHRNTHGIAYQTARTDLLNLVKKGFFEQIHQGKVFYFVPSKKLTKRLKLEK